jgi:hypothetical protein
MGTGMGRHSLMGNSLLPSLHRVVDWPPLVAKPYQISPLPSFGQHAKKHKCGGDPPSMLRQIDPRDEVKITWIDGPTSITINRGYPLTPKAWTPFEEVERSTCILVLVG